MSVITITRSPLAERGQHLELMGRGRRTHRVQCHDERLGELTREREHVLAVAAAEDAVLVLEQHDVDVESAEQSGGADVVARATPWEIVWRISGAGGSKARRRRRQG